jgi:hypothetical protein
MWTDNILEQVYCSLIVVYICYKLWQLLYVSIGWTLFQCDVILSFLNVGWALFQFYIIFLCLSIYWTLFELDLTFSLINISRTFFQFYVIFLWYVLLEVIWILIATIEVESRSQTPSLLRLRLCMSIITSMLLMTFTTCTITTMQLLLFA